MPIKLTFNINFNENQPYKPINTVTNELIKYYLKRVFFFKVFFFFDLQAKANTSWCQIGACQSHSI